MVDSPPVSNKRGRNNNVRGLRVGRGAERDERVHWEVQRQPGDMRVLHVPSGVRSGGVLRE